MILIFALAAFTATLLGGIFALRFRDKLHLILGFSAGAVIGVALFDLVPEAIDLASGVYSVKSVTTFIAVGFVIFMILDRILSIHSHGDEANCSNPKHGGFHGAATLAVHSFLDGFGIGLAFKVSPAVGIVVAVAVLAHDFSDGINTVNYILKNKGRANTAFGWLIADALAPVVGIIASLFITFSQATLGLTLALFAGFFLYIGASDLIPESHHRHPKIMTTIMTILGILVLYLAIYFAE